MSSSIPSVTVSCHPPNDLVFRR
ncbi:hypothetical protein [Kitasatospora sp. NPDC097691]